MIRLGRLNIYDQQSIVEARKKFYMIAIKCGCSDMLSSALATVLTEIFTNLLLEKEKFNILCALTNETLDGGILFEIEGLSRKIEMPLGDQFFELFEYESTPEGKYKIRAWLPFKSKQLSITKELIHELRKDIYVKSRDELLKEIIEKNAELAKSQGFLSSVLENIKSAIYSKDTEGRYTFINSEWEEKIGISRELVLGKRDIEIFPGRKGEKNEEADLYVIKNNETKKTEETIITKSGIEKSYSITKVPMIHNGKIIGVCSISTDISELKKTQNALVNAKIIAEEATNAKSDFLANMSHEIRTPLNAILGMAYLMQKTDMSEKQKSYMDKICQSSQLLLRIINDILDFSKIEAGKLNLEENSFYLKDVLDNLNILVGEKCISKGLELIFDVMPNVPEVFIGDQLRLGQILINYVNNAVKFTDYGEIIVRIEPISIKDGSVTLKFEVKDTGIGLTDEQKGKLFQSFQQADTSTTRKYGGSGLGLAISKQLANLMNGDVGVESELGRGSTFWFTVKLKIDNAKIATRQSLKNFSNLHVLVIDDNNSVREIIKEMLNEISLRVDTASSGEQAIKMVKNADLNNDPYEIIYVDMIMKGINGIQTTTGISQLELQKKPHYIMITNVNREEIFTEANRAGIELVLIKPVNPTMLFEATLQMLSGNEKDNKLTKHNYSEKNNRISLKSIKGAEILLVEDNDLNIEVAKEILEESGFKIDIALNGQIAVNKVNEKNYDLILMDMQMPIMDGIEATRRIRENSNLSKIPIVAMTANAMEADVNRCFESGINDHLAKPIEPEKLFEMLLKYIPRKQEIDNSIHKQFIEDSNKEEKKLDLKIEGLNTEAGLKRLLGNQASYIKLLKKFVEDYKDIFTDYINKIENEDFQGAKILMHTLKGVSGTLGAEKIQENSSILENNISKDLELAKETELLLKKMMAQLEDALLNYGESKEDLVRISKEELINALEEIKPFIKSFKPKQCAELLLKYRGYKWPVNVKEKYKEFDRLVSSYKYKEALEIYDDLIKDLRGEVK